MIFKTFNNDIDKWTAKIGIFGKSFNELGTAIKNALWTSRNEVNNFGEEISFWDALKNNLLPKKEDITSQLIDVMPEINTDNLVDATEKIKNLSKDVTNGTTTWQELFDTLPEGQKHFAQLGQQMEGQIITTEGVAKANQSARDAALANNAALKQQTLGAKAATVAMKALSVAGKMIAYALITKGIELAANALDKYANRVKYAQEDAESFVSSVKEMNDSQSSNASTIASISDEYSKLSKGVNSFGENVSLTSDEYARYQSICNQVVDIMPGLLQGYDDQGKAILKVKGNLADLNAEYAKTQQREAIKTYNEKDEDGKRNVSGTFDSYKYFKEEQTYFPSLDGKSGTSMAPKQLQLKLLNELSKKTSDELLSLSEKEIQAATSSSGYLQNQNNYTEKDRKNSVFAGILKSYGLDSESTDEEIKKVRDKMQSDLTSLQNDLDTAVNNLGISATTYAKTLNDYWDLGDTKQSYLSKLFSNMSVDFVNEAGIDTEEGMQQFVSKTISIINENKGGIDNAFRNLFDLDIDSSKLNPDEIKSKIDSFTRKIGETLGVSAESIKKNFNLDEIDKASEKYTKVLTKFNHDTKISKFFSDNSINTEEEIDKWNEYTKGIKSASEAIEVYNQKTQVAIDNANKNLTLTDFMSSLNSKTEDGTTSSIDTLTSSLSTLGETIQKLKSGTATQEDLLAIYKQYPDAVDGVDDLTGAMEQLKYTADDEILGQFNQKIQECQKSNPELAESLIKVRNEIKGLTDDYYSGISAFEKWQQARQTANSGANYDTSASALDEVKKLYNQGLYNTDDFKKFAQYISPDDSLDIVGENYVAAYQKNIAKYKRYFTSDSNTGIQNILNDMSNTMNSNGKSPLAEFENGNWKVQIDDIEDASKKLGISSDEFADILNKLNEYGDINFVTSIEDGTAKIADKYADITKWQTKLNELKAKKNKTQEDKDMIQTLDSNIKQANADIDTLIAQMDKLQQKKTSDYQAELKAAQQTTQLIAQQMNEVYNNSGIDEASKKSLIQNMYTNLQSVADEYHLDLKTTLGGKNGLDTSLIDKYLSEHKELLVDVKPKNEDLVGKENPIHTSIDGNKEVQEILDEFGEPINTEVFAKFNSQSVTEVENKKENLGRSVTTTVSVVAQAAINMYDTLIGKVNTYIQKANLAKAAANGNLSSALNTSSNSNFGFGGLKPIGLGFANGTKSRPITKDQKVLVNELGTESIMRDGKWFTIEGGTQVMELKKGDIVFNHLQTEKLLKYGALHNANSLPAFGSGNAFGTISFIKNYNGSKSSSSKSSSKNTSSKNSNTKATNSNTTATNKNTSSTKKNTQTFDWVSNRLEYFGDKTKRIADSITDYISYALHQGKLSSQIRATAQERNVNRNAYSSYMKKANKVGLSAHYRRLVQSGNYSIQDISNEKLSDKIQKYQDLYSKAQDCKDKVAELNREIQNLKIEKYQLKLDTYESKLNHIETASKNYEEHLNRKETLGGYSTSANYIQLNKYNSQQISYNNKQISVLKAMQRMVSKTSKAWYDYQSQIDSLVSSNSSLTSSILENLKAIADMPNTIAEARSKILQSKTDRYSNLNSVASAGGSTMANYKKVTTSNKLITNTRKAYDTAKAKSDKAAKAVKSSRSKLNSTQSKASITRKNQSKNANELLKVKGLSSAKRKAIKNGDYISTKGLKGSVLKKALAYNKSVMASNKADKLVASARKSYSNNISTYNKLYANTKSKGYEHQVALNKNGDKLSTGNEYEVQNQELDRNLKTYKAEAEIRNQALFDAQKNTNHYERLKKLYEKQLKTTKSSKGRLALKKKLESASKKLTLAQQAETTATENATKANAEYAQQLTETAKQKFANVKTYYDNRATYRADEAEKINSARTLKERKGETLTNEDFLNENGWIQSQYNTKAEELKKLNARLQYSVKAGTIKKGTAEWYELKQQITDVEKEVDSLDTSMIELNKSMLENQYKVMFEDAIELATRLQGKISDINDLITDEMLYDEDGAMTQFGFAKLGMNYTNYESELGNMQKYLEEQKKIQANYDNGVYKSQADYEEHLKTNEDNIAESLKNLNNYKTEIINMVKSQSQAELDALNSVINKRKENLQKKKDYYDYDKQLKNGNKELSLLRQQADALAGLTDQESLAAKARLEEQIAEKQQDMDDTVRDHVYNLQVDGLSDLSTELQDSFDKYFKDLSTDLDKQSEIVKNAGNLVKESASLVEQTVNNMLGQYGVAKKNLGIDTLIKDGVLVSTTDLQKKFQESLLAQTPLLQNLPTINSNLLDLKNLTSNNTQSNNITSNVSLNITGDADVNTEAYLKKMLPTISDKVIKTISSDLRKAGYKV